MFSFFKTYEKGTCILYNRNSDRVLENHPLIKERKIHKLKWMLFPHDGFSQGLERAPSIMGTEPGSEMMLICKAGFLLVF